MYFRSHLHNHVQYQSLVAAPTSRTPCTGRSVQALTTPSSHKYFPRFKNDMLKELCQLFNKTVFGGKVCES